MSNKFSIKKSHIIASAVAASSLSMAAVHNVSASDLFGSTELESGYQLAMSHGGSTKSSEGKCGEGKCGNMAKSSEAKCGGSAKSSEGKCGGSAKSSEGKCGGSAKSSEGKCGEGKCGSK